MSASGTDHKDAVIVRMNKAEWYTIVALRGDDDSPDPSNASKQE